MDIQTLYYDKYRASFRLGTYLALLKTMSIAHLVVNLYGDTRLNRQTFERLGKTRDFIRTLIKTGINSQASQQAFAHMNRVHSGLPASQDDFVYVLSCFILEPIHFRAVFRKKPLSDNECIVLIRFWQEVGRNMNLMHLPGSLNDWLSFQRDYEAKYQLYSQEGSDLARKSLNEVVKLSLPFGTRLIAKQLILNALSRQTLQVLVLPKPVISLRLSTQLLNVITRS